MDSHRDRGGYQSNRPRDDHPRDDRAERDRSYQCRNPFSGSSSSHGKGGYDRHGNGNGGHYERGGGQRDRNGGQRDRNEGQRDRNGGQRDRNGGQRDRNGGQRDRNEGNRHGNGGYRGGGYSHGESRERSGSAHSGSYDKNSGNGGSRHGSDHAYDAKYEQPLETGGRQEKRPPPSDEQAGPSKRGRGSSSRDDPEEPRDPNRPRRDRYEIVRTLPDNFVTKKGSTGQHIRLRANFFELNKRPDWDMVMYRIDFEPECPLPAVRKYLMWTQKDLFGSYLYDTQNSVYLTHRLAHDITRVESTDREGVKYLITIKFGTTVPMDTRESLQVLNLILRRSMECLKLELIGRNLFDPQGRIDLKNFGLQLWPGYITSIRQHESNVLLCTEIATKVMRLETVYDILTQGGRGPGFKTRFTESVLGLVVLTDYNNKTYRINDVDWDKSPSDTFTTKTKTISFIDYYRDKYRITIRNPSQPMLISRSTEKQRRGGEEEIISLIPELCRPTGLTDQQRNNWQLMKGVADHTRLDPRNRMDRLRRFNERLHCTAESLEILKNWNFQLNRDLVHIDGRVLRNENIIYGDNVKEPTLTNADWQMAFKDHTMYMSFQLRNWCIIVPRNMRRNIDKFINDTQRASRQMRFEVQPPTIIEINDRNDEYPRAFQDCSRHDPQLIMIFVANNNADRYASIKKIGCCDYGIATQVIVQKTLNNKNLLSIATKVAIQLNCKLGGIPWLIEIPTKGLMTIGIDVSRDTKNKKISWGSMVATMDLKNPRGQSFFSTVSCHTNSTDFSTQLGIDVTKAIRVYEETHSALPEKICVYRDGVGEGQTKFVYETELTNLRERLVQIYSQKYGEDAKLKFAFIVVSKKINTRIFGSDQRNPPPGTIVDDVITLPERYDFYLVSQVVRQGTVSPTSYNVLYDSMGLNADRLQQLTYKQCHLYYNWAGTVRVPAVCQYAHKLTFLAAQCLHSVPKHELEKKLYFL